jgi:tetratricopeptide (TPR) repeat protein
MGKSARIGIFCLATFSTIAACNPLETRKAPGPASAASGSPAIAPSDVDARLDLQRRIALTRSPGSGAADVEIGRIQAVARKSPSLLDTWIALGRAWVRKARESSDPGFYVNANACAEVALGIVPDDFLARDLETLVLLNDHRFQEAQDFAEATVQGRSDDPAAYGYLSDARLELGRFEEAATAAQTMVDLKPNLPAYSRASYLRWLQGDVPVAREFARRAIDAGNDRHDPEPQAWAIVQSAMYFWHEGDYEGADAGFELALSAVTDYPPALVGRARVALARGEGRRASDLLARAYAQSPLVATAWLLGDARAMAGDDPGASAAYALVEERGRSLDPRTLSVFLSTKNRRIDDALALARAEMKVRSDVYTCDALGWALYRSGLYAEARQASDRALRLGTPDASLLYHAGAIRIASGQAGEGQRLIKRALAMNPEFDVTGAAEAEQLVSGSHARSM